MKRRHWLDKEVNYMKQYITLGSRILSIIFLFIAGYELTCGVFLWGYYLDKHTAVLYFLKGMISLILFLLLFYEADIERWFTRRKADSAHEDDLT